MPGILDALVAFVREHQRCGELDGGRDNGYIWRACSCGRRSSTRLPRLPQHRHERYTLTRQRDRDDLLPVPAPVDIRRTSEELPAHVPEMLDAKALESHGHLSAAAWARAIRAGLAALVEPSGRVYAIGERRPAEWTNGRQSRRLIPGTHVQFIGRASNELQPGGKAARQQRLSVPRDLRLPPDTVDPRWLHGK